MKSAALFVAIAMTTIACTASSQEDDAESGDQHLTGKQCDRPHTTPHVELLSMMNGRFEVRYCVDGCSNFGTFCPGDLRSSIPASCNGDRIRDYLPKIVKTWSAAKHPTTSLDAPAVDPSTCSDAMELEKCLQDIAAQRGDEPEMCADE